MISFMGHFGKGETIGIENKSVFARGYSCSGRDIYYKVAQGDICGDLNILYLYYGGGYMTVLIC